MLTGKLRSVLGTTALAAALAAAAWGGRALARPPSRSADAQRIYVPWAFEEFSGGGTSCVEGWQWHDAWGTSQTVCGGGRVRIAQTIFGSRGQGMLWQNAESGGLLPPPAQGRNVAVEVRLRYPAWYGYGTDGVVIFQDPYDGERTCFDNARGHHHDDPHCPNPPPAIIGHSHAAGGADWRSAKADGDWNHPAGNGWSVWDRGTDWIIARWEYRAQDDHWDLRVYRTDDGPDDPTRPYGDRASEGHWTRTAPAPEAVRIGHHIWFTGHRLGDGAGEWTDPEVDYVRVWTWDVATPTPTATHTAEPTDSPTPAPTSTATPTDTPTPAPTSTPLPTGTPIPTPTDTPTPPPLVLSGRAYADVGGEAPPPGVAGVDVHLEARYRKWAYVSALLNAAMPTPSPTASPSSTPEPPTLTPTPTESWDPTPTATPAIRPTIPRPTLWASRASPPDALESWRLPLLPLILRDLDARVPRGPAASSPVPRTPSPTVPPGTPRPEYRWTYQVLRGDHGDPAPTEVFSETYWSETPPLLVSMAPEALLPGSYRYQLLASRWFFGEGADGEIDSCYSDEAVVHMSGGESARLDLAARQEEALDVCLLSDVVLEVTPQAVDDPVFAEGVLTVQTGSDGDYDLLVPWSTWPDGQAEQSRGWDGVFIRELPPFDMTPVAAGPGSGPAEVISPTLIRYPWSVRDDGTTYGLNDFALRPPATPTVTPSATPAPTATPSATPAPTDTPWPTITPSPTPDTGVTLPGGEVFVHVYEQSASADPHTDYRCDELIGLEMQRWASLAPIFAPESAPLLCHGGACEPGAVSTRGFTVTEIANVTGRQPVVDAPGGRAITYQGPHAWGETSYERCEGLWFLALSQGGRPPAAPSCPRLVAREGYPGTYRFQGTLAVSASWTTPVAYVHEWTLPITFWVALRAPRPQASGSPSESRGVEPAAAPRRRPQTAARRGGAAGVFRDTFETRRLDSLIRRR